MKNLFRSFNKLKDEDIKELWDNAVFVFDTNVLHSVYRYQSSTCEEVLKLMELIQDRIWVPYHVALEFHRNRLDVIAGQHKKFDDTRVAINKSINSLTHDLNALQLKRRHSYINPEPLLDGINQLRDDYLVKLDELEGLSLKVESTDPLLIRIESVLTGRVGPKPKNDIVKEIMNNGKDRYAKKIPPGYKDANKAKESDNQYTYDGVTYERQFGDLLVWKQIIEFTKSESKSHLIFVTDDNKEDWWQVTKGKVTGFRNELIDEIYSETDLKSFNAYNLTSFLTKAGEFLNKEVSQEAIEEVEVVGKQVSSKDEFLEQKLASRNNNAGSSYEEAIRLGLGDSDLKFAVRNAGLGIPTHELAARNAGLNLDIPTHELAARNAGLNLDIPTHELAARNAVLGLDIPTHELAARNASLGLDIPTHELAARNAGLGIDIPIHELAARNAGLSLDIPIHELAARYAGLGLGIPIHELATRTAYEQLISDSQVTKPNDKKD
ncbi:PIN-like domain-containing protein [Vibrio cyclitrophicus]